MVHAVSKPRRSKYDQLCAVFELFHSELGKLPDDLAVRLCKNWHEAKRFYADALASRKATRSKLASGLEQGLREMPQILSTLPAISRQAALKALAGALQVEYPGFLQQDQERLAKIRGRKVIRSESEYYLVRHNIDLLEGSNTSAELAELYALVDHYRAK